MKVFIVPMTTGNSTEPGPVAGGGIPKLKGWRFEAFSTRKLAEQFTAEFRGKSQLWEIQELEVRRGGAAATRPGTAREAATRTRATVGTGSG